MATVMANKNQRYSLSTASISHHPEENVGSKVGLVVGSNVGSVGSNVGSLVGSTVGWVGLFEGAFVGEGLGSVVG